LGQQVQSVKPSDRFSRASGVGLSAVDLDPVRPFSLDPGDTAFALRVPPFDVSPCLPLQISRRKVRERIEANFTTGRPENPLHSNANLTGPGSQPGKTATVHLDRLHANGLRAPAWDADPPLPLPSSPWQSPQGRFGLACCRPVSILR